jgi:hypothetical protein
MDIQMPNKMDMKRERFAYCLMGSKSNLALTAGIMIDEKRNVLRNERLLIKANYGIRFGKVLIKWLTK